MKKKLDTDAIQNELAGSVFFPSRTHELPPSERRPLPQSPVQEVTPTASTSSQASEKASSHASKHARTLALEADLQGIHKIVKFIGKEVLYVRLTQEEKNQVADIEYTYQRQGMKTSGNEIGRIALNVLLADYKANGENSLLAKILTDLHT